MDGRSSEVGASADFDRLFREEHPRIVALALALTGEPEAARDLAQEAFARAFASWGTVAALDRPGAWIRRVAINGAMSWHRSRRREGAARARLGGEPTVELPATEGERFWSAVRRLPERQRAAVALYYLEDRSVTAVAAAMGIAEGTVKATLRDARRSLAAALGVGIPTEEVGP